MTASPVARFDVVVVGSGAAGLIAGQEAAKNGLSVLVVSK
jgi:succinate dehydrogenase/fumarate reductase flavoprotein subunit